MKRFVLFALCAALLLPALALAQGEMVSLSQLKEQVPAVWSGSYEGKDGKTVTFEAPVLMPEAEEFPVLRIERVMSDQEVIDAQDVVVLSEGKYGLNVHTFDRVPQNANLYGTNAVYHNAWAENGAIDAKTFYAQGQDISLDDVSRWLEEQVEMYYGEDLNFVLDEAETYNPACLPDRTPVDYPGVTGKEGFGLGGMLTLNGIPLLGVPPMAPAGYQIPDEALPVTTWAIQAVTGYYYSDEVYRVCVMGNIWREKEKLEEDVPLCSFETVENALAKLIADGKVHNVMAVYLGYCTWFDPEVDINRYVNRDRNDGKLEIPCVATPTWIIECQYQSIAGRSLDDYPAFEGGEPFNYRSHMWGHTYLAINAQTGEVYPRTNESRTRKVAPAIVTWDDVK